MSAPAGFSALDWAIVAGYLLGVVALGLWFVRRQKSAQDYFLGGRRTPAWAAAVSVVATSVSAATFIGAPEQSYKGNLTYLAPTLAGFLAVVIVAHWFIPAFYRLNVSTVYGLLEHRFGPSARRSASAAFMAGRLLASGARLFVAALPVSEIVFGDHTAAHMTEAIAIAAAAATLYTVVGGLEAVIWTEVPQALLLVFAAVAALILLLARIPLGVPEIWAMLSAHTLPDGTTKTTIFDVHPSLSSDFSVWSALTGMLLFNIALYGTDQDLTQRLLSCRTAAQGARSAIISNIMGLAVGALFLVIGLLLFVFYAQGSGADSAAPPADTRTVFLHFILTQAPSGVRGLMLTGLFAATMSSLASTMQAMASTLVCDFYRPRFPRRPEAHYLGVSRLAVAGWGILLAGFAIVCIRLQESSGQTLISFAIGVMLFTYTGLLGVFLAALFTRRGNTRSATLALLVGAAVVAIAQFALTPILKRLGVAEPPRLGLGATMLAGVAPAFLVCIAGRPAGARSTLEAS